MPYAEGTRSVTAQGPGKDGTRAPYPYGSQVRRGSYEVEVVDVGYALPGRAVSY